MYNTKALEMLDRIKNDCTEILSIYKSIARKTNSHGYNFVLWRGIGGDRGEIVKSNIVGVEQTGNDICSIVRTMADRPLKNKGHIALRSNSIMTSAKNIAKNYGIPYAIFPKDGSCYTWFEKQSYSYILFYLEEIVEKYMEKYHVSGDPWKEETYKQFSNSALLEIENEIAAKMIELKPSKCNISKGIKLENEFYITGMEYYAIREDVLNSCLNILL